MFRVYSTATAALAIAVSISAASSVSATQATALTGFDKLHAQARVDGKTCMTEHEHGGEGTLPSKKGATEAAVRHWESFTAWEYGKTWGSYRLASGKRMECTQGGAGWICRTAARPCRR